MSFVDAEKIKDESIKNAVPYESPVTPVELDLDSEIQFHCHKNISCFNACCKNIDITITPYDIIRLKRRFNMTSSEWVNRFTMPFPMDGHDMPGLKLSTKPGSSACIFLEEEGCSVYEDRLFQFSCRFLKQVLFGEMSIPVKSDAREVRLSKRAQREKAGGETEPSLSTAC